MCRGNFYGYGSSNCKDKGVMKWDGVGFRIGERGVRVEFECL